MALYFCQSAVASAANGAPSISGSPATTAYVGKVYSFQPTASDPDGNKLTFKISAKPAWAAFSRTTGRLTGTPSSSQTGTYSNIVISVTDGLVSKALPAFAIKVAQATATTTPVTLSWVPPTRNVDGTLLTDLTGYKVFYGKASGQYPYSVSIGSASVTSVVIEDLAAATWYFAIKAVTGSGTQSDFSTQISKTVR
jgi:Putative Ig domain